MLGVTPARIQPRVAGVNRRDGGVGTASKGRRLALSVLNGRVFDEMSNQLNLPQN